MGRHPLCLLLLSAFVASSLAIRAVPTTNTSYVVITSDVLIPGSELLIDLHLLDLAKSDIESDSESDSKKDVESDECILGLSVSTDDHLWHRSVWKIELDKTPKSFFKTLRVLVSPDETFSGDKSVLKVESSSCFKFSHSVEVPTGRKELLVSLRTDKLKYHPGDLVMVEALVHTEELKPYLKPVNLSIHNSHHVLLVEWLNVTAEEGLLRKEFFISLLVQSDKWTLTLESHDQLVNHTFNVEQPVGPYDEECFMVEVRSPRYHTLHSGDESKSNSLDISVMASLPSGVPLKGKVELQLSLGNISKSASLSPVELEAGHKEFSLKPDEIKQYLGMKTEEPLVGQEVKVSIKVEELRPVHEGSERESDSEVEKSEQDKKRPDLMVPVIRNVLVTFVDQSHVLFFSQFTPAFFKPGLTYVGHVLLKPVDEVLPLSPEMKEVTVNVKHYTSASEDPRKEKLTLKLKPNSLGEFSFKVPKEDVKLELEAQFEDKESDKLVTAHLEEILPFATKNKDGYFVQVSTETKPPKVVVNEALKVKVETSFPTSEVLYQVFCQSILVFSGKLMAPSPATKHDLSLIIPQNVSHLLSSCRLVVEVLSPSHEILSDSLRFVVEQELTRPLEVLVKPVAEPGEVIEVVVKAEPFTSVYLLTTADLPVFEPKEQQLRKLMAFEKMLRYVDNLNSSQFSHIMEEFGESISNIPSIAPDSQRVHNESGSLMFSDGVLFADQSKPWPTPVRKNGTLDDLEPPNLETMEEFYFLTWNLNVTVGPSGEGKLRIVLPDDAKLYTIAAFGLIPGKGLVITDTPVQLLSTSKVMASLRHPESMVRGEEALLEVHLFNNQDKEAKVQVSIKEPRGMQSMDEAKKMGSRHLGKEVVLKPKELGMITLPLKMSATSQEPLEFQVEVVSAESHHQLNSSIELEYQGYEVMLSESFLLDNFNGKQVLDVDVPKNMTNPIEKSERALVNIYGHPFGPAIEHICQRLKESDILEERLKLDFILAVNVLEHISNNSLFDNVVHVNYDEEGEKDKEEPKKDKEEPMEEPMEEMKEGSQEENAPVEIKIEVSVEKDECIQSARDYLQYLLNKKNADGSVSFYPNQPGYIWLTSLMLDSTILLRNVLSWKEEQVVETLQWLAKQQKEDGSFVEHKDAIVLRDDLDEESHHVPLTSQAVASLIEASKHLDLPEEEMKLVEMVTKKAVEYIRKTTMNGDLDKDSYSLNLAAYALALAKSDEVFEVLKRRNHLRVQEDDEEHWKIGEEENVEESSLSVEATSYAILTSMAMNDLDEARPFVNFVMKAMKPNGMFVTSQDSYVALKALSKYFRLYNVYHEHDQVTVDVNITLSQTKQPFSLKVLSPFFVGSLYFDHSNLSLSSPLKVESSGKGVLLVQNVPEFNSAVPSSRPTSVDLKVEVKQKDPEHLLLKVCAVNLEKEPTSFLVCEVPLLSGYELNLEKYDRKSNPQVLKQDNEVYLIFDEVKPSEPTCMDLSLDKLYQVENLAPRFVKLYPGTEPGNPVYKPYGGGKSESS